MRNFKSIKILFLLLLMVLSGTQISKAHSVEQRAEYINGGDKGLLSDLYSHLSSIMPSQSDSIKGRCVFKFVVSKEGIIEVESIKLVRNTSLPDEYVNAAKEAIEHLGKFTSGEMNGTPIRTWYNLPVIYPIPLYKIKTSE
ncbi:MAG: hypothetical protein HDS45_01760 [Bacteroides sp.]|nr:hypothetical protein [Bacteroides sp.]